MKVLLLTVIFVYQTAAGPIPVNDNTYECFKKCSSKLAADFTPNKDTIFTLYTRRNSKSPQTITFKNIASIRASNFNKDHPTRFIIHGYLSHGEDDINKLIRSAYIEKGDFNIITVNWEKGATFTAYLCAKDRVEGVGAIVGMFILWLKQHSLISLNKISVIGHSLGAHAAGFTGKYINRHNNNQKLHSIIALDPAKPCIDFYISSKRVASTDAEYVEVIHTSVLGIHVPIGSADFYPNWGNEQPEINGLSTLVSSIVNLPIHSHSKAYYYFADSINNPAHYKTSKCASYHEIVKKKCTPQNNERVRMGGEPSNHGARGIYYYHTINPYLSSIITMVHEYSIFGLLTTLTIIASFVCYQFIK